MVNPSPPTLLGTVAMIFVGAVALAVVVRALGLGGRFARAWHRVPAPLRPAIVAFAIVGFFLLLARVQPKILACVDTEDCPRCDAYGNCESPAAP